MAGSANRPEPGEVCRLVLGVVVTGVSAEGALVEWRARHARRMALRCAALGWAMVDLREARRSHLAAAQIARGAAALASRKRRDEERQERTQQDALQPPIEQAAAAAQAAGCSGAAPSIRVTLPALKRRRPTGGGAAFVRRMVAHAKAQVQLRERQARQDRRRREWNADQLERRARDEASWRRQSAAMAVRMNEL